MKKRLTGFILQGLRIATTSKSLLFIIGTTAINLLLFPSTGNAFQLMPENQMVRPFTDLEKSPLVTIMASPIATSVSTPQNTPDQQVITEAQNNVSIAAIVIYWSQYELAGVGLVFAAIGFLGLREFSHFVRLRKESELRLKTVSDLEQQVEKQLEQLTNRSASESQRLNDQITQIAALPVEEEQKFEQRLEQFSKQFESESQNFMQTFMEASYNFNVATDAYRIGNNERAIEYFLLVLNSQPKNTLVMERLGRAYSNLNNMNKAIDYLENKALAIDPSFVPALRSLALCYRYSDRDKAIDYFQRALKIDPSDYETWDFLGLLYRDNQLIDEAISAHKHALDLKRRPETQFYLSILYAIKGDEEGAKAMSLNARYDLKQKEHKERIRPVWQILICAGVPIIEGNVDEAYQLVESLSSYITTQRICDAITGHLKFLLKARDHEEWIPKFTNIVKVKETQDATT